MKLDVSKSVIREARGKLKREGIIKSIQFLIRFFLKQQFIRFCIVGTTGVMFNYSIFFVMLYFLKINYLVSSATGFILAIFWAYSLNKRFTFKVKFDKKMTNVFSLSKYFGVCIFSLVLGLNALWFLVSILHITPYISNFLIIGITTVTNYLGSKYIVFGKGGGYG